MIPPSLDWVRLERERDGAHPTSMFRAIAATAVVPGEYSQTLVMTTLRLPPAYRTHFAFMAAQPASFLAMRGGRCRHR